MQVAICSWQLHAVVRSVLNEEPSDENMETLFKLIDTDNRCVLYYAL